MSGPSLPPREWLARQTEWLAAARQRVLRRAGIARRRRVLDLACGYGAATGELVRRSGSLVVAVDRRPEVLAAGGEAVQEAARIAADAARLPFRDGSFDLVYCQFALMWLPAEAAAREIHRVLEPGGVLVALEPDYGGMIEHPPAIASRQLWISALDRAGADPQIGRRLPGLLAAAGFGVRVDLLERLEPAAPSRFDFLRQLPLTPDEQKSLAAIEAADRRTPATLRIAHLPVLVITAARQSR